jgi:transcriptional antiterminator RfaH
MHQWFLAQIKPNADQLAKRNLERQSFVTFQPLERRTRVRGGKFETTLRPFFPGYLFISYPNTHAPWSLVNSTYGVARLVSFCGKPASVPNQVIADLRAACCEDNVMVQERHLKEGAYVEVSSGPFSSFLGQVERLTPDQRVLVLLDFMGKQTRVNLPAADLRPALGLARAGAV